MPQMVQVKLAYQSGMCAIVIAKRCLGKESHFQSSLLVIEGSDDIAEYDESLFRLVTTRSGLCR